MPKDDSRETVGARDDEVVALRTKGKSFVTIAKTLGLDGAGDALTAFNRGIRSKSPGELARFREEEGKRLDLLARRVSARTGELGADDIAKRLKRVERLRADLLAD
jgi:hypothetical protein